MDGVKEPVKSLYDQFVDKFGQEVKAREGNNIRVICPSCKHKSLSCNIQNGLINCFHCGYGRGTKFSGPASGFVEEPVDSEMHEKVSQKIIELCTLSDEHKKYLTKRGIYHPEKYNIVSSPFRFDKILLNYFSLMDLYSSGYFFPDSANSYGISRALTARRILIPFWQGDKIISLKSRARPDSDDPNEVRYICPKGSKIKSKVWYKEPITPDVIITEGELCAIAAQEIGFSGFGIPGIAQISSTKFLNELKTILVQHDVKRSFIILDSDPGIENDWSKLQHALNLGLYLPNSCIVYLPQDSKEEKMDLDLFLSRHPIKDLTYLMEKNWINRSSLKIGLKKRIEKLKSTKGEYE
jgi:hypothetical protein